MSQVSPLLQPFWLQAVLLLPALLVSRANAICVSVNNLFFFICLTHWNPVLKSLAQTLGAMVCPWTIEDMEPFMLSDIFWDNACCLACLSYLDVPSSPMIRKIKAPDATFRLEADPDDRSAWYYQLGRMCDNDVPGQQVEEFILAFFNRRSILNGSVEFRENHHSRKHFCGSEKS